jgi:hypothetical protein
MPFNEILTGPYPRYSQVMQLARTFVNDAFAGATCTPGEGQILTDDSAFAVPMLRSVTSELYQELGNITGTGVVIRDNFQLINIPPVHGAHGWGIPDPSVQVYFSYNGYFDGRDLHPRLKLPPDLIFPLFLWERTHNTNNEYEPMYEAQFGIPTAQQTTALAFWEWREDKIFSMGSLIPKDVRVRYIAVLPLIDQTHGPLDEISVPIQDCERALALKMTRDYGLPRGSDQVPVADAMQKEATFLLKNRYVRSIQTVDFRAEPYGDVRLNFFPLDRYR